MAQPIDFYFDFSSPYGYFASAQIDEIAALHSRAVTWHPILLGAVFKITNQQPLPTIPVKGAYAQLDFERTARLLGARFKIPGKFPISSVAPSRAFYAVTEHDPDLAKRLARALLKAYFAEDRDISTPEVTIEVAARLGLDRKELADAMQTASVKERLRREVDEAIGRGVFGSPYVIIDGEPFWGSDRLDQVEKWLATGGW